MLNDIFLGKWGRLSKKYSLQVNAASKTAVANAVNGAVAIHGKSNPNKSNSNYNLILTLTHI